MYLGDKNKSLEYRLIKHLNLTNIIEIESFLKDEDRVKIEMGKYLQKIMLEFKNELEEKIRNEENLQRKDIMNKEPLNMEIIMSLFFENFEKYNSGRAIGIDHEFFDLTIFLSQIRGELMIEEVSYYDNKIIDIKPLNLSNINFKKSDLSGIKFSIKKRYNEEPIPYNLESADLSETNFYIDSGHGVDLINTNFKGAKLGGSNLYRADISESNLEESDLYGVNLVEAKIEKTNLSKANLTKAFLSNASFKEANLSEAKFNEAYLTGATFDGSNFSKSDFSGAFLSSIKFNYRGCNFNQANFSGAKMNYVGEDRTPFGNECNNCNFTKADLRYSKLSGNYKNSDFSHAIMVFCELLGGDFSEAKFITSDLRNVKISTGNNYKYSKFFMADFTGANMESLRIDSYSGYDFSGAIFNDANLVASYISVEGSFQKASFVNANLEWSELGSYGGKSDFTKADFSNANLRYSTIKGNFSMANFSNADLTFVNARNRGSKLYENENTFIENLNFQGANFARAKVNSELKQVMFKQDVEGFNEIQWI